MHEATDTDEPWFRNPWVWLMIGIPALTVVGCLFTIYIAISNPDYRVDDARNDTSDNATVSQQP